MFISVLSSSKHQETITSADFMCLVIFAYKSHKEFPLLVAANRDEFYERDSEASHFWPDQPDILAGRDCVAKGTWMGISKRGRFAAITNGTKKNTDYLQTLSRGSLTTDFLIGEISARQYAHEVKLRSRTFNSFHLIINDMKSMWYVDSHPDSVTQDVRELGPGIYGLSNAGIHSEWPKCKIGKDKMSALISSDKLDFKDLKQVVSSRKLAEKAQLAKLGLQEERDLFLSAQFVATETYGTRCSTVMSIDSQKIVRWLEESFDPSHTLFRSTKKQFDLKCNSNKEVTDE